MLIWLRMVKRLESLHENGLLHWYLKPNNLTWANYNSLYNTIFISLFPGFLWRRKNHEKIILVLRFNF